jgi:hypothetical protein
LQNVGALAAAIYAYFAFKVVGVIYNTHHQTLYPYEPTAPDGTGPAMGPTSY